jgi:hypothetical protein
VQKTRFSKKNFRPFFSGTTQLGAIKLSKLMGHDDLTQTCKYEQIRFIRSQVISQSPKSFDPLELENKCDDQQFFFQKSKVTRSLNNSAKFKVNRVLNSLGKC